MKVSESFQPQFREGGGGGVIVLQPLNDYFLSNKKLNEPVMCSVYITNSVLTAKSSVEGRFVSDEALRIHVRA